jgi:hypothetical protein
MEIVPFLKGTTDMRNDTRLTEAGRQYAEAYAAHYTGRDLPVALQLYRKVMASHPDAEGDGIAPGRAGSKLLPGAGSKHH